MIHKQSFYKLCIFFFFFSAKIWDFFSVSPASMQECFYQVNFCSRQNKVQQNQSRNYYLHSYLGWSPDVGVNDLALIIHIIKCQGVGVNDLTPLINKYNKRSSQGVDVIELTLNIHILYGKTHHFIASSQSKRKTFLVVSNAMKQFAF